MCAGQASKHTQKMILKISLCGSEDHFIAKVLIHLKIKIPIQSSVILNSVGTILYPEFSWNIRKMLNSERLWLGNIKIQLWTYNIQMKTIYISALRRFIFTCEKLSEQHIQLALMWNSISLYCLVGVVDQVAHWVSQPPQLDCL